MATISKGITLTYSNPAEDYVLTNLLEIPELGDGETDTIEITTLTDAYHRYTDGLKNYGDSLAFKFLYEKEQFNMLSTLNANGEDDCWFVTLPSGDVCRFGGTCSVKLDGVGTNAALTYTLNIKPNTAMEWNGEA